MPRNLSNPVLTIVLAEIWRTIRINFRGFDAVVEVVSSVIFILGITLTIAVQNPSILKDPHGVSGISWGVIVFIMISDKLWILGHSLDREKRNKILENILATNTPMWIHTLLQTPAAMIWTLASLAIASLTVFPMLGVNPVPADPVVFIAGYVLSETMASGVALIYSIAAMIMRRPWIATNVLQFVLPVVSGMIPYSYAPQYLREIMLINPLSYPIELLRRGATGIDYMPVDPLHTIVYSLAGIAAIYIIAIVFTNHITQRLRRTSM